MKHLLPTLLLWLCGSFFSARAATVTDANDSLITKYLSNTNDATAKIKALMLQAEDIKHTNQDRGEPIKRLQIALTLVPFSKDSPIILSKLYAQFGSELFEAGTLDLAVQYIQTALEYQRKADPGASSRAYNLLGKIASFYLQHQQYDSAQYYYNLTLSEAKGLKDPLWIASANNNQGILFFRTGKLDKALECFNKAKKVLVIKVAGDSVLDRSINDNLAQLALKKQDYTQAARWYHFNLTHYGSINTPSDFFKTNVGLAEVAIEQRDFIAAAKQLQVTEGALPKDYTTQQIDRLITLYSLTKKLYTAQGYWKEAVDEQNKISQLQDSLGTTNHRQQANLLQALTYSQVYQFKQDIKVHQARLQQQSKDLWRVQLIAVIVTFLSIVILVLLYLYNKERHRIQQDRIAMHKKDQQLAEANLRYQQLEQEKLERELQHKKTDISDLALYLSKLKDVNDNMMERLEAIKGKKPEEQKSAIHTMTNELGALIHSHEKINMIQENIELVNKEFSVKLMTQYPDLTKSEIELCGFFRMNMSNKEIGQLKNIAPESVKMARYRMRKKFSLGSDVDFYKFLSTY